MPTLAQQIGDRLANDGAVFEVPPRPGEPVDDAIARELRWVLARLEGAGG